MATPLATTTLLHAILKHTILFWKTDFKLSIAQLLSCIQMHYELPKMKMMQEMSLVLLELCCTFNSDFCKAETLTPIPLYV